MELLAIQLDQRPVPAAALRDKHACELMRIWIAENGLHCSLRMREAEPPAEGTEADAWGVVLAHAARQLAQALRRCGHDADASIARIRGAFIGELGDLVEPGRGADDAPGVRH